MVYLGSKNNIAKYIIPIINEYIKNNNLEIFIDGFVGGANIIANTKIEIDSSIKKIGFDKNEYLIELLNYMKNDGISKPIYITKEEYDDVKDNKQNYPKWYVGYVGFIIGYSGKWFNGYTKNYCDKEGKRDYIKERFNNLKKQSKYFKNCKFYCYDFFNIDESKISKKCIIYLDPPYKNTTKYKDNITNYDVFWEKVRRLSSKCIVLVSEYTAPKDFNCIWESEPITMSLHNKRGKNGKTNIEKLWIYNNIEKIYK